MKRFRRIMLILLAWVLFANGVLAVQVYSSLHIPETLRRYASFVQQENGDWTVHDQFAEQLIRQMTEDELETYAGKGIVLLYPSLRGNEPLGLVEPVLNVFLICKDKMNGNCVSIALTDAAWHFAATPQVTKYDHFYCEHFALALDAAGLELLAGMSELPYSLRIWGDDGYITVIVGLEENLKGRQKLESSWRKTLASFVVLCDELELENYPLWDLNAAYWSERRPESMRQTGFVQNGLVPMDETFHVVDSENVKGVQALQQLLADAGFYAGKANGAYDTQTRTAIRDAQQYYGLAKTGLAGPALLAMMKGEAKALPESDADARQPVASYRFEGMAEIRLEHAWLASSIMTYAYSGAQKIQAKNSANHLLAADGYIHNLSGKSLNLAMELNVRFVLNGVSYPGNIRSVQNNGTTFGFGLLPGENARIICYAEIPDAMVTHAAGTDIQIQPSIPFMTP